MFMDTEIFAILEEFPKVDLSISRALRQFQQVTENARRDTSKPETIEVPAISTAPSDVSFVSY
jgi:hypothetical protein